MWPKQPCLLLFVENSQVVLPAQVKASIVTNIVMPLLKDKLPWYVKPFASKLIGWFIDVIIAALNKLFTKQWGKEVVEVEAETVKAEGTN